MENKIVNEIVKNHVERDDKYPEFLQSLRDTFDSIYKKDIPLFRTDATGLWDAFLNNLPEEARQHYTCNCCRHFIDHFGSLVTISEDGIMKSILWDETKTPELFVSSVKAMKHNIIKSRIKEVFITDTRILGIPKTGEWQHFALTLPSTLVKHRGIDNAGQLMAKKREDFKTFMNALKEYPIDVVEQAVTLLQTDSLYRSEKCLGVAEWLRDIHKKCATTKNDRIQENMIWYAVATSPEGFCHVKSSMIGTLLQDIADGLTYEEISNRFKEKMNPLQYQRPQAAPTLGNIQRAEEIFEKLGLQSALNRRFARIDEIEKMWVPKEKSKDVTTNTDGVFGHLKPNPNPKKPLGLELPPFTMTWKKFYETVLPNAEKIEFYIENYLENFTAIVTAADPNAKPIIQWDNEEKRNPYSWYLYYDGSTYYRWNLQPGYCNVTAITYYPSLWYEKNSHHSKGIILLLEGAKDTLYSSGNTGSGNGLFPEILKSELREVRSTIEAYSRDASIEGYEESSACGVAYGEHTNRNITLRVTTETSTLTYKIDRWD
jgi:hypothetical protein